MQTQARAHTSHTTANEFILFIYFPSVIIYIYFLTIYKFYKYGLETYLKPYWAFFFRPLVLVHKSNKLIKIFTVN